MILDFKIYYHIEYFDFKTKTNKPFYSHFHLILYFNLLSFKNLNKIYSFFHLNH